MSHRERAREREEREREQSKLREHHVYFHKNIPEVDSSSPVQGNPVASGFPLTADIQKFTNILLNSPVHKSI